MNRRLYRLSDPELHSTLSMGEQSLRRLVAKGALPARRVLGTLMVSDDDVEQFLASGCEPHTSRATATPV